MKEKVMEMIQAHINVAFNDKVRAYVVNNLNHQDFTGTRRSIIQLLTVPPAINIWLWYMSKQWIRSLRASISLSVMIFFTFKYIRCLNYDFLRHAQTNNDLKDMVKNLYGYDIGIDK